jgi:plastocyanin
VCLIAGVHSLSSPQQISVTGRVELSGGDSRSTDFSGAVVWLEGSGERNPPAAAPSLPHRPQLVQKNKNFSPHLLVIPVGTSVEFPNRDPFFHNVFSLFEGKRFDLGLYEAGSTRSEVFIRSGISYIFCNIHPEMSAVVVALKTPYYGISDRRGAIVIGNVPPGTYQMKVWHERVLPDTLNGLTRSIVISAASNSIGVLRLPEQRNFLQTHKNKYGQDYEAPAPTVPGYVKP